MYKFFFWIYCQYWKKQKLIPQQKTARTKNNYGKPISITFWNAMFKRAIFQDNGLLYIVYLTELDITLLLLFSDFCTKHIEGSHFWSLLCRSLKYFLWLSENCAERDRMKASIKFFKLTEAGPDASKHSPLHNQFLLVRNPADDALYFCAHIFDMYRQVKTICGCWFLAALQ